MPLSGMVVICWLVLAMVILPMKFVFIFTHYKDMKAMQNVEIGVVMVVMITQGHWQRYHSIEHIRTPV